MRIGELAEKAGVTPRALRYYEEVGLLRPARTATGQRVYEPAALERVSIIRELYAAGLGSDLIVSVLEAADRHHADEDLLRTLTRERAQLTAKMAVLRDAVNRLDVLIGVVEHPEQCPVTLSPDGQRPSARLANVPA